MILVILVTQTEKNAPGEMKEFPVGQKSVNALDDLD